MTRTRRSGFILMLCGVASVLFFYATDPRSAFSRQLGWDQNVVDATHQALIPTAVGVAGSILVLFIGLWLVLRRSA